MKQLLVVDDSRLIRLLLRQMLEARGFSVAEAENGRTALDHCRTAGPPQGIILDVNMPEMDGLACLRAVRSDPALQNCIVVMCSTQADVEHISAAVAAGANEYVMKPFTEEILCDKLRQVGLLE